MNTAIALFLCAVVLSAADPVEVKQPTPPKLVDADLRAAYWQAKDQVDLAMHALEGALSEMSNWCGPNNAVIPDQRPQTKTPNQPLCMVIPKPQEAKTPVPADSKPAIESKGK